MMQGVTLANKLAEPKRVEREPLVSQSTVKKRPSSVSARNMVSSRFQASTSRMSNDKMQQSPSQVGRIAAKKYNG